MQMGDERVRLYGVDAPESKQMCTTNQGKEYACGAWRSTVVVALLELMKESLSADEKGRSVCDGLHKPEMFEL